MSVADALSYTRSALWPKVEYNSSPGLAVNKLMRRLQESVWADTELKIKMADRKL